MEPCVTIDTPLVYNDSYSAFRRNEHGAELSLVSLGHGVFILEKELRSEYLEKVFLPLSAKGYFTIQKTVLAREVERLLNVILVEDLQLSFVEGPKSQGDELEEETRAIDDVCLFSGGVDSLCGLLDTASTGQRTGALFCSHTDQSKIQGIVLRLTEILAEDLSLEVKKLEVPPLGVGGFAHLRGFLYMALAAAWTSVRQGRAFIVSEVGPTMYQPRLAPLDEVTLTTHPYVLEAVKGIGELVLGAPVEIKLPYEDATKAEVMARCKAPNLLPLTHSCISQRFGSHDGTCYGCVIRRLSALAAGVPDTKYRADPLVSERANGENLLPLLDFSAGVLLDLENLEWFRKENIEIFSKEDLFRRFALDMFAGIHRLRKGEVKLRSSVASYYHRVISDVGEKVLEDRLAALARMQQENNGSKNAGRGSQERRA